MNFGEALTLVKHGQKIHRLGWNGSGMWVELQRPDINSKMTLPYLFLAYPDGRTVPWLASQTDLLSSDWDVRGVPTPPPTMRFKNESVIVETTKKPHWTQTPEGKKKMAMRRKKGSK